MKKTILTAMILLASSIFGMSVSAQNGYQIKGVIVDASGPVIGAAVVETGTSNGVTTGLDGDFVLTVSSRNSTVEISCIGYASQTFTASAVPPTITLVEDADYLDEVVVVGYGTVKRRDLTGSVASVSGEKIAQNPVTNIVQALQGALPGISVTTQDGRPGANVDIRVRGGNSMTQSNSPLYVVDGVVVSTLEDIPADNIASLDVLKDAASTAIYGARGGNGVIMVTTKNVKEQKASVRYSGYYQIKTAASRLETLNAQDYVWNQWTYATAYADNYGDNMARYFGLGSKYGNHFAQYANVATHDWFDDIIRTAGTWNHDISISGGGDKTKVYATVGYNKDDGIRIHSGSQRWNANLKVDQWLSERLKFSTDIRYSDMRNEGSNYELASTAYRYRPIDKPLGEDNPGLLMQGSSNVDPSYNPIDIIEGHANISKTQRLRATTGLTWTPVAGLTAKSEVSLSRRWTQSQSWKSDTIEDGIATASLTKGEGGDIRWTNTVDYVFQNIGNDHNASILAGYEILTDSWSSSNISGAGYPAGYTMEECIGMISMTDASLARDGFSNSINIPSRTISWFGRANYSFKGRYLFTATFRADGSSKFGPNNRWGYFPAGAFAWRLSDEPWMQGSKKWINDLKVRLSYGTSGADNISSALWKETWSTSTITVDGVVKPSFVPNSLLGNPDLKWETTISRNLGFDYGLFDGRLTGTLDFYWNTTKNSLMRVPIDSSTGYEYQYQNVGQVSNKGLDLSFNVALVRKNDFNLNLGITYNYNHNNVDILPDNILADCRTSWNSGMLRPGYDYLIRQGMPVGLINGFVSEGFYGVDDFDLVNGQYVLKAGVPDIDNSIIQYAVPKNANGDPIKPNNQFAFPGMFKFKDVNGDGKVNAADATIIGKAKAEHSGGFNLNGRWKNLDFSAAFTYQIGGAIYNVNALFAQQGKKDENFGMNRLSFIKDCFNIYDIDANGDLYAITDMNQLRSVNANAKYGLPWNEYGIVSSDFIEDASYLRLQNVTVGYTLPKKIVNAVKISNARVYITGYNLFCLSGYSGLDPEVNTQPGGASGFPTPNYDYRSYPKARSFTFGVNITF